MKYHFEDEERIIWLRDREALSRMGYVRERFVTAAIRTGPPRPPEGEVLIGYAVLKRSAGGGFARGFMRRIFTLQPADRYFEPEGLFKDTVPPEAVDPGGISAGQPGVRLSAAGLATTSIESLERRPQR